MGELFQKLVPIEDEDRKFFEVIDHGKFYPVLAVRLNPRKDKERWLISRGGFGNSPELQKAHIILITLDRRSIDCSNDPYSWLNPTIRLAHNYIRCNWERLKSGDTLDIKYLEEETEQPKPSLFREES